MSPQVLLRDTGSDYFQHFLTVLFCPIFSGLIAGTDFLRLPVVTALTMLSPRLPFCGSTSLCTVTCSLTPFFFPYFWRTRLRAHPRTVFGLFPPLVPLRPSSYFHDRNVLASCWVFYFPSNSPRTR